MGQDLIQLKKAVHLECQQIISEKISSLQSTLKGYQDAANQETKSSAGDKYETGRAMMHLEKEKIAGQLDQALKQQRVISQLNPEKYQQEVQLGSVLESNRGIFYISVSLGLIQIGKDKVMCISPVAPLGKMFLGAKAGNKIQFNNMTYEVAEVN